MKERPILFSGQMVRAILEGRKTQTRRIAKEFANRDDLDGILQRFPRQNGCRYGRPGDQLWVRETTRQRYLRNILTGEETTALCGEYVADGEPVLDKKGFDFAWWYSKPICPSIFMPRWASRITLELTGVHIERLGDITEAGARAEGIFEERNGWVSDKGQPVSATAVRAYEDLWHSINGSWLPETWVWVLAFRRVSA